LNFIKTLNPSGIYKFWRIISIHTPLLLFHYEIWEPDFFRDEKECKLTGLISMQDNLKEKINKKIV
jgi:hypothetical protein